jgi:hypothetical protein
MVAGLNSDRNASAASRRREWDRSAVTTSPRGFAARGTK